MDPDATLVDIYNDINALREFAGKADHANERDRHDAEIDYLTDVRWTAESLADAIESLDNWLKTGGFLPKAWTVKR